MQRISLFSLAAIFGFVIAACGGVAEENDPTQPSPNGPADQVPAPSAPSEPPTTPPPTTNACDGSIYVADVAKWRRAGSNPKGYEMSVDASRAYCEKPGAHVRSLVPSAETDKFGTFMDIVSAVPYRGKRVRLRGIVETANVVGWAGLWLRVDDADHKVLAFDNMGKRALRGTLPAAEHAVVLDVANDATEIAFGILLAGGGELWTKQVVIEIVGPDVPTTGS